MSSSAHLQSKTLTFILAGGEGERLYPLTADQPKPVVPFGGVFRIIDFTLSNCLNSGLRRILVLTQYKAMSLDRHINLGWRHFFCRELGEFIDVVPPQQRIDEQWYQGTADAVYQNIYTLEKERPEYVVILAGDHIYKMDYAPFVAAHRRKRADVTIAVRQVPLSDASRMGILAMDENNRIVEWQENFPKPFVQSCAAPIKAFDFVTPRAFVIKQIDAGAWRPAGRMAGE